MASAASWIAYDGTMTYILTSTTISKWISGSYSTVYTFNSTTFSAGVIASYSNRVVVGVPGATTAAGYVFVDNSNNLTQIFSHSSTGYASTPSMKISPQLKNILIYGVANSSFTSYFYYIDYASATTTTLTFPASAIFDPANILIMLEDNWLYIRQLYSVLQTVSGGNI